MAIKILKPINNSTRQMSHVIYGLKKTKPSKILTIGKKNSGGRNVSGKITVRRRGGGSKRLYRIVDFNTNDKMGQKAKVETIEYDPNRSALISLIKYTDGDERYIITPEKLKVGDNIVSDKQADVRIGNRMLLKNIPPSTNIFNIELSPGRGGQIVRSAGNSAILLGFDENFAQVKLSSGESRKIDSNCMATIGIISNSDHNNVSLGKAGRVRLMGRRPKVRGKAKNAVDHPHGGGEGGSPIGLKYPKTPWGAPALGRRTRKKKKKSDSYIIKKRR